MIISKKRFIKFFKIFLVSRLLQKVVLISSICFFILFNFVYNLGASNSNISIIFESRLQTSFDRIKSSSDFYDWIDFEFSKYLLGQNNSTDARIVLWTAPRLVQFRISESCIDRNAQACNPYNKDTILRAMQQQINLKDATTTNTTQTENMCVESDCGELTMSSTKLIVKSDKISAYPDQSAFVLNLDSKNITDFHSKIQQLRVNGWLDDDYTFAFIFQFNYYDSDSRIGRQSQYLMENIEGIWNPQTQTHIFPQYSLNNDSFYVMFTLYLITTVLFLMKTILECNLSQKASIYGCLIMNVIQLFYIIIQLTELQTLIQYKNNYPYPNAKDNYGLNAKFFYAYDLISIHQTKIFFLSLTRLTFPFRVFMLCLGGKYLTSLIQILNSVYRTFLGLGKLILIFIIIVVCWSCGLHFALRDDIQEFELYSMSIVNYFLFPISSMNQQYFDIQNDIFQFAFTTLMIMRFVWFCIFVAFIKHALFFSFDLEFETKTPQQREFLSQFSETIRQIEKFYKWIQQKFDSKQEEIETHLIAWLNYHVVEPQFADEIKMALQEEQIQLIEFSTAQEIQDFLLVLFNLKPHLLYQSSDNFRIIIDYSYITKSEVDQQNFSSQNRDIISVLESLNEKGSRVPVMIYSDSNLQNQDIVLLQTSYSHVHITYQIEKIMEFVMLIPLADLDKNHEKGEDTHHYNNYNENQHQDNLLIQSENSFETQVA